MTKTEELKLPNDVEQCRQLIVQLYEQNHGLQIQIQDMQARLNALLRSVYGRKSEAFNSDQLRLFSADEKEQAQREEKVAESAIAIRAHGRKRPSKELPRTRLIYDVPETERACPDCGAERGIIGEEISEQYNYVPSSVQVIEHVRIKRACKGCSEHVVIADKPNMPIDKGLAAPGMLAYVATSKYADHSPLNRLEGMFRRDGAVISRSTMCDWMLATTITLLPLYERMKQLVLSSEIIWTDDTPIKMQDRQHEKNIRNARVWVYIGDSKNPYTIFDFTESRNRDGPVTFLKDYRGYLQADAFAGYDCIYAGKQVKEVACWAHARRKFYDAQSTNQMACAEILELIAQLYHVEREAHDCTADERYQIRQQRSLPLLKKIRKWLDMQSLIALPKSPLGQAVAYALKNWDALCVYLEQADLTIDNNKSERALRATAVGRKNWLFVGSARGGQTAAVLSSFMATCKVHDINPRVYLQDVLTRLAHGINDLDSLLPDRWQLCS